MSDELVTVAEHQEITLTAAAMSLRRIRHVPVVRGAQLVGVLTHRDLLRTAADRVARSVSDAPAAPRAGDLMTEDVQTVSPDTPAEEAALLLVDHKIGCLPVVDGDGTLVGIVTEADFLRWAVTLAAELRAQGS